MNIQNSRLNILNAFSIFLAIIFNQQFLTQTRSETSTEITSLFNKDVSRINDKNSNGSVSDVEFSPTVTATCRGGTMTIQVKTVVPFVGVVHSRDYRKPSCSGYGENTILTLLRLNMMASADHPDYCGVFHNSVDSEERSVAIAVRNHRTLELAGDKYYMITCGKAGFENTRNQTSLVNLRLLRKGRKVERVVYGREYTLRAFISESDGKFGIIVQKCFSFSDTNNTVQLIDENGCPETSIISEFQYVNGNKGIAEAKLFSMFKFPETDRVHFQCDVLICRDVCIKHAKQNCDTTGLSSHTHTVNNTNVTDETNYNQIENARLQTADRSRSTSLLASYSVFVVQPGSETDADEICSETNCLSNPPWLLYVCISLGVLFILMLMVNMFLCSTMTCLCQGDATQDDFEDDNSDNIGLRKKQRRGSAVVVEEFDPYTRSWHGSNYESSRFSLNERPKPVAPPVFTTANIVPNDNQSVIAMSVSSGGTAGGSEYGCNGMPAVYGLPSPKLRSHKHQGRHSTNLANQYASMNSSVHSRTRGLMR